jgi:hypothetical protein
MSATAVSALARHSLWGDGDVVVSVAITSEGLLITRGDRGLELPFHDLSAAVTHTTVELSQPSGSGTALVLDFAPTVGPRPASLKREARLHAEAAANGMRELLVVLERNRVPTRLVGLAGLQAGGATAVAVVTAVVLGLAELTLAAVGAGSIGALLADQETAAALRVAVGALGSAALVAGLIAVPIAATARYLLGGRSALAVFDDLMWHTGRPWAVLFEAWMPYLGAQQAAPSGEVLVIPFLRPRFRLPGLAVGMACFAAAGAGDDVGAVVLRLVGTAALVLTIVSSYVRPGADPVVMDEAAGRRSQRLRFRLLLTFVVGGVVALAIGSA